MARFIRTAIRRGFALIAVSILLAFYGCKNEPATPPSPSSTRPAKEPVAGERQPGEGDSRTTQTTAAPVSQLRDVPSSLTLHEWVTLQQEELASRLEAAEGADYLSVVQWADALLDVLEEMDLSTTPGMPREVRELRLDLQREKQWAEHRRALAVAEAERYWREHGVRSARFRDRGDRDERFVEELVKRGEPRPVAEEMMRMERLKDWVEEANNADLAIEPNLSRTEKLRRHWLRIRRNVARDALVRAEANIERLRAGQTVAEGPAPTPTPTPTPAITPVRVATPFGPVPAVPPRPVSPETPVGPVAPAPPPGTLGPEPPAETISQATVERVDEWLATVENRQDYVGRLLSLVAEAGETTPAAASIEQGRVALLRERIDEIDTAIKEQMARLKEKEEPLEDRPSPDPLREQYIGSAKRNLRYLAWQRRLLDLEASWWMTKQDLHEARWRVITSDEVSSPGSTIDKAMLQALSLVSPIASPAPTPPQPVADRTPTAKDRIVVIDQELDRLRKLLAANRGDPDTLIGSIEADIGKLEEERRDLLAQRGQTVPPPVAVTPSKPAPSSLRFSADAYERWLDGVAKHFGYHSERMPPWVAEEIEKPKKEKEEGIERVESAQATANEDFPDAASIEFPPELRHDPSLSREEQIRRHKERLKMLLEIHRQRIQATQRAPHRPTPTIRASLPPQPPPTPRPDPALPSAQLPLPTPSVRRPEPAVVIPPELKHDPNLPREEQIRRHGERLKLLIEHHVQRAREMAGDRADQWLEQVLKQTTTLHHIFEPIAGLLPPEAAAADDLERQIQSLEKEIKQQDSEIRKRLERLEALRYEARQARKTKEMIDATEPGAIALPDDAIGLPNAESARIEKELDEAESAYTPLYRLGQCLRIELQWWRILRDLRKAQALILDGGTFEALMDGTDPAQAKALDEALQQALARVR